MDYKEEILKWVKVITTTQKTRDKRAQDLFDFMEWAIENIPLNIRLRLKSISVPNYGAIELTAQDLCWWKNQYKSDKLIIIPPIEQIEAKFLDNLTIICNQVVDSKAELEETIEKIVIELQNKNKNNKKDFH